MRMDVTGMDDVIRQLEKLSSKAHMDGIAKKAVNAALPVVTESVRSHIHPRDVAGGVVPQQAKVNDRGVFGVAKVTGTNSQGQSNAMRAAVLEYGRHDGRGGHIPWRAAAVSAAEGPAMKIMEETVKSEMGCE